MDSAYIFLFTKIASTEGFLVATLAIIMAFLFSKNARSAVALFASAAGVIIVVNLIKETLQVARPSAAVIEVTGYAFPSGHAAGSAFLAAVVIFLARNLSFPLRVAVTGTSIVAALAIGASRIGFQVHTPLQVLAGFAIGIFFAFVFARFASREKKA
jgi:undecaprenyl-diphosphatase